MSMERKNCDSEVLLRGLRQGDERAFRILFEEFYTALCLFATRFLGDSEAAADVVQEAFLKYWDRHTDFDNYYKIKSFFYVVVRHACLNRIRDQHVNVEIVEDMAIDSDEFFQTRVMEEEAYRVFYRTIDHLPQQMRTVIYYALEGLKNAEIAQKMGVSENAVHAYKKEAYKRSKESMKDYYYLFEFLFLYFLYS